MAINGIWINEYGSEAELRHSGNTLSGLYRSHTGATGVYPVVGFAAQDDPSDARGAAVCLAIAWHSLDGGEPDPSWSWCSAMSGQAALVEGGPRLILQHCMIASTPVEGLCTRGIHLDKLAFVPKAASRADGVAPGTPGRERSTSDRRETWTCEDGRTFNLAFGPRGELQFEDVRGTVGTATSKLDVAGLSAASDDGEGRSFRSLALTSFDRETGTATAWAGLFAADAERVNLHQLASQSTAPQSTYVQTTIEVRTAERRRE